jgi:hypothetical protein
MVEEGGCALRVNLNTDVVVLVVRANTEGECGGEDYSPAAKRCVAV